MNFKSRSSMFGHVSDTQRRAASVLTLPPRLRRPLKNKEYTVCLLPGSHERLTCALKLHGAVSCNRGNVVFSVFKGCKLKTLARHVFVFCVLTAWRRWRRDISQVSVRKVTSGRQPFILKSIQTEEGHPPQQTAGRQIKED